MDVVSGVLLVAGGAWMVLAAVGVLKFDDVFSRMHSGTKATTLGVVLVTLGAALRLDGGDAAKLAALVAPLLFLTSPVGAHLVGRAAHKVRSSLAMRIDTVDELAEVEESEP